MEAEEHGYKLVCEIGSGASGSVYLAKHGESGTVCAIKYVQRDRLSVSTINEAANHWYMRHPLIVEIVEVFVTPTALAIVMEYSPGGSLCDLLEKCGPLQEGYARWIFQQLIIAVDYMHKAGLAHRDIKVENIVLDKSERPIARLCDFGVSKHIYYESEPHSRVGTLNYLSPEQLGDMTTPYDGKACDVWACGVVLYAMLMGKFPFQNPQEEQSNIKSLVQNIVAVDYNIPRALQLSDSACKLLSNIFVANPEKRITVQEVQQMDWFLKDLPQGAQNLNYDFSHEHSIDEIIRRRRQGIEEVLAVLQDASSETFNTRNSQEDLEKRMKSFLDF